MANPFAESRTFHRIGHVVNTSAWKLFPTPAGLAVVTTTGRKSGKPRARAMRAVRDGNNVYAVSILGERADWLRNLRVQPEVTIKLGGQTRRARGRVIEGVEARSSAIDLYRPIAGWYDYADYANFVWDFPTRAKLLRVHDEWFTSGVPVVFELQDPA